MEQLSYPEHSAWNYVIDERFTLKKSRFYKIERYYIAQFSISYELFCAEENEEGERCMNFESNGIKITFPVEQIGEPIDLRKITIHDCEPFSIKYMESWLFLKTPPLEMKYFQYRKKCLSEHYYYFIDLERISKEKKEFKLFYELVQLVWNGCFDQLSDQSYREITSRSPALWMDKTSLTYKGHSYPLFGLKDLSRSSTLELVLVPQVVKRVAINFQIYSAEILHMKKNAPEHFFY